MLRITFSVITHESGTNNQVHHFSWMILQLWGPEAQEPQRYYCWWKKSCTTFKGLHLKPRAPNLTLFEDTVIKMDLREWRKSCTTRQHVIQHWASECGGTSCALAHPRLYRWCRISSTHRRKKRISCIFGLAHFFPSPTTSRGSNPSSVLLIVPPVCFTLHLHTAEHEAKWATW